MSKMFDKNVKHYKEKFESTVNGISEKSISNAIRSCGINDEFFKAGLLENSEQFRVFCHNYSKTLMPGHVSCTTYASVVAVLAKKYGVDYKAYAGFCLPKSYPKYEEELASFDSRKGSDPHPIFANHVFLVINGEYYEFFNGTTSDIDHIDCVEI